MKVETLRALHAEWRKVSPGLSYQPSAVSAQEAERETRLWWTNEQFHRGGSRTARTITSWNELKPGEAKFLLKLMREESGDGSAYRAMLIAKLAVDLFGADWDHILRDRLMQRFRHPTPHTLLPSEAHAEIEELLSRIARRDGVGVEEVRKSFSPQRMQRTQRCDDH
jgi:hypothetical protein